MASSYVELHCASAFSFLQGASLPEALVERAAALGYSALALMDRDGVYGAPRFHRAATAVGIRPLIGAELTIAESACGHAPRASAQREAREASASGGGAPRERKESWPARPAGAFFLPVLCESAEGYRNLCRLITRMHLRAPKGEGALTLEDLDGHTAGLVAFARSALLDSRRFGIGGLLDRLTGLFGRDHTYVELQRHYRRGEEAANRALIDLASAFRVPVIATNGVRFATAQERPLFDVLTCIHHHTDLTSAGRRLVPNAERYLKPPEQIEALFADCPAAITAARELADRLQYTMADLGYRFPDYPVPPGETQATLLRNVTDIGARNRYRPYHDRARAQIARELDLIEKLDLAGYFLIVWDIVNFCRQHDILVQGRGSAANSAVCYSLGITAVDPVGMDLLFERFLSEERGEWPDIDLDLPSGDRREQVIQHIYEKYGRCGAAMTANVITYRGRSAAREVGKVLGFDPLQIDRLAKVMNHFEFIDPADTLARHLASVGLDLQSDRVRLFASLWTQMQDLPRHLGQHSGGMVICQGQLDAVVPLENATMPGRVVVQWDKDDCADMGIVKVDLLGLGMMAVLQDAITLVNGPEPAALPIVDLAHLPADDPAVYRMLQEADTVGVFQVESRAQMATLPRLKPTSFYDLVVEVAIIRPGPIVGQMVHPYLNRRAGKEAVVPLHPSLEPVLARTLGVPLFQEQLLRMAMVAAGFTGGQAEELRRAMGFKRSERRMQQIEVQLRGGMAAKGITGDTAERIITSITSFALYGFPESHAASFALLAYASAYLKVHFPAAFYTALLNNQPMGFYHPATLVKDAQRRGVRFQPIDVQISNWDCTVESDGSIRLGLRYVSGLRQEAGKKIASACSDVRPESKETRHNDSTTRICPKCGCDDPSMLERMSGRSGGSGREEHGVEEWFCNVCSYAWSTDSRASRGRESTREAEVFSERGWGPASRKERFSRSGVGRFRSLDDLIARTTLRRDEVVTLADIGALNSFGYDRRSALWQAERAVRPAGELFDGASACGHARHASDSEAWEASAIERVGVGPHAQWKNVDAPLDEPRSEETDVSGDAAPCPLKPMTESERIVADFAGMGLSIGRHPMALRRDELAMRGIVRAIDLRAIRQGRRVRVAGMVITRQRPGTAKGFVFLTLEDETGIANIIVHPDLFTRDRLVIIEEPFVIVEGVMQNQEGVLSIRAEAVHRLRGLDVDFDAHDFY